SIRFSKAAPAAPDVTLRRRCPRPRRTSANRRPPSRDVADRSTNAAQTLPAIPAPRMDPNLGEVEQAIEKPNIPIGGPARADVSEHANVLAREMVCADRSHRAGTSIRPSGDIDDRYRTSGLLIYGTPVTHINGDGTL